MLTCRVQPLCARSQKMLSVPCKTNLVKHRLCTIITSSNGATNTFKFSEKSNFKSTTKSAPKSSNSWMCTPNLAQLKFRGTWTIKSVPQRVIRPAKTFCISWAARETSCLESGQTLRARTSMATTSSSTTTLLSYPRSRPVVKLS